MPHYGHASFIPEQVHEIQQLKYSIKVSYRTQCGGK